MGSPPESDSLLREVAEDDLVIFFEKQQDPVAIWMAAFTAKDPADWAAFATKWARILSDGNGTAKTVVCGGRVAGDVTSFVAPWSGQFEVSYWVGRDLWGRGVATRALAAFVGGLAARPLYARAAADNRASIRVLEKCGSALVGRERGFANARGAEIEEVVLELREGEVEIADAEPGAAADSATWRPFVTCGLRGRGCGVSSLGGDASASPSVSFRPARRAQLAADDCARERTRIWSRQQKDAPQGKRTALPSTDRARSRWTRPRAGAAGRPRTRPVLDSESALPSESSDLRNERDTGRRQKPDSVQATRRSARYPTPVTELSRTVRPQRRTGASTLGRSRASPRTGRLGAPVRQFRVQMRLRDLRRRPGSVHRLIALPRHERRSARTRR